MERRQFLKGLIALPLVPNLLKLLPAPESAPWAAAVATSKRTVTVPTGTIMPWAGEKPPAGWLTCEGQSVPQFMFPKLHEALGDAFGKTDWRTFRLPDFRVKAKHRLGAPSGGPYPRYQYLIKT